MSLKRTIRKMLFSNKPHRFIFIACILIIYGIFGKRTRVIEQEEVLPVHGVITTLIRSNNHSINLAINMIHSVLQFHSFNYSYPFIIFHDENFTASMRERMLFCILKNYKHVKISFEPVDFQTSIKPANTSRLDKPIGYRLMCRFWTYDIFYHPAIVRNGYDYLMRMDDDSYFSDQISEDLFLYTHKKGLDYIYRATYGEATPKMQPILQRYVSNTRSSSLCIYNNFFVMRLKWFYESKQVQSFINDLITDNLMLREYIGDGCTHSAMLAIDQQVKSERVITIPYGHNKHLMPPNRQNFFFHKTLTFDKDVEDSCDYLIVARGTGPLLRIGLSK